MRLSKINSNFWSVPQNLNCTRAPFWENLNFLSMSHILWHFNKQKTVIYSICKWRDYIKPQVNFFGFLQHSFISWTHPSGYNPAKLGLLNWKVWELQMVSKKIPCFLVVVQQVELIRCPITLFWVQSKILHLAMWSFLVQFLGEDKIQVPILIILSEMQEHPWIICDIFNFLDTSSCNRGSTSSSSLQ